jgi:uncharacterized protein YcfJ
VIRTISKCAIIALAMGTLTMQAEAKGCIKGALIGGAVGHYAGHHGTMGALAGCVIGRHEANKREREQQTQPRNSAQPNSAQ